MFKSRRYGNKKQEPLFTCGGIKNLKFQTPMLKTLIWSLSFTVQLFRSKNNLKRVKRGLTVPLCPACQQLICFFMFLQTTYFRLSFLICFLWFVILRSATVYKSIQFDFKSTFEKTMHLWLSYMIKLQYENLNILSRW